MPLNESDEQRIDAYLESCTQAELDAFLEEVARMAIETLTVNAAANPISQHLLDKHFLRKHGRNASYGQRIS